MTPEEKEKQKAIENAYKSAIEKIPDKKPPADPWGAVRSTTPSSKPRQGQQLSEFPRRPNQAARFHPARRNPQGIWGLCNGDQLHSDKEIFGEFVIGVATARSA